MRLIVKITKEGSKYRASLVTSKESLVGESQVAFNTYEPLDKELLTSYLEVIGFHSRDIREAFIEADNGDSNFEHELFHIKKESH